MGKLKAEEKMPQQDQKTTAGGTEGVGVTFDTAADAMNSMSKNIQAIAGEIFEISKQSFEHTTRAMEELRQARGMDEVLTIQMKFVREALEHAAQHTRKFSELMTVFPAEMTKTYQDMWRKSVNSAVKATETASQTAAENMERFSETAKKTSNVFDRRESA
ncbi:MAG TPA: phasin family protein [Methylocella sp.]|nr:phasin family protein [Methylocella sp.]